jgi:sec-independent protein translocase protein TatA
MGELSWWHWLIVVAVFVLLFGSKRLPDAARSLGRSMRIFKTEIKHLHDDDDVPAASAELPAAAPAAPAAPPTPTTSAESAAQPVAADRSDTA